MTADTLFMFLFLFFFFLDFKGFEGTTFFLKNDQSRKLFRHFIQGLLFGKKF